MRLTMGERRAVIRQAAAGYCKASKKRKGQWLDELVALTGYHRRYAVRLLRAHGRRSGVRVGCASSSMSGLNSSCVRRENVRSLSGR